MAKYTFEQVVRGIEFYAAEFCFDEFKLRLDDPLHVHLDAFVDQEVCPLMFLSGLADYFGIYLSEARVVGWLKLERAERNACCGATTVLLEKTPRTGRDLVEFIIRRATCPDFSPRTLLGNPCKAAGLFLGIASSVDKKVRVAPSTCIREVISVWEYADLTSRLGWMFDLSKDEVAAMKTPRVKRFDEVSSWFAVTALVLGVMTGGHYISGGDVNRVLVAALAASVVGAAICCVIAEGNKWNRKAEIAPGIRSFRDLTNKLLAAV